MSFAKFVERLLITGEFNTIYLPVISDFTTLPFIFQCHHEFQNIESACGLFVICFIPIATLTVYGREIFIFLGLTPLRMENIQSDIYGQDYGAN